MKPVAGLMMLAGLLAAQSSGAASLSKGDVKYEARDHSADIREQEEEMRNTADPDLKQFAGKALDTVTAHKQKVDAPQALVK